MDQLGGGQTGLGRLISIQRSHGGVPKCPVAEATITFSGLEGDEHNDHKNHGGPDRAIVLYSWELIQALQREGHPIFAGSTGENLTISGLEWDLVVPRSRLYVGNVELLVTNYANPCNKIAGSFEGGDIFRVSQKAHPGWSRLCARVIVGGLARQDDLVKMINLSGAGPS